MKVLSMKEFWIWLLVNILAPVTVPLGFAMLLNVLVRTGNSVFDFLLMFWKSGAFVFLGLFVLISLVPHFFENYKPGFKTSVLYVFTTSFSSLITCFIFLSSLNLISSENAVSFEDNLVIAMVITVCSIFFACVIKYFVLQKKNESSYK